MHKSRATQSCVFASCVRRVFQPISPPGTEVCKRLVCRRHTGLLLVLAARCPSDSITQAPFKKKKCFSPRSELTALCRKHIPVPCTIDFPVKKRQANPSKLVASIHALAVSSLSHQQQEARLLPNISFIPNAVSYKARGEKKKIKKITSAALVPPAQVYAPLSQHHAPFHHSCQPRKASSLQGQLLSEVPLALGNTRDVGNSPKRPVCLSQAHDEWAIERIY